MYKNSLCFSFLRQKQKQTKKKKRILRKNMGKQSKCTYPGACQNASALSHVLFGVMRRVVSYLRSKREEFVLEKSLNNSPLKEIGEYFSFLRRGPFRQISGFIPPPSAHATSSSTTLSHGEGSSSPFLDPSTSMCPVSPCNRIPSKTSSASPS